MTDREKQIEQMAKDINVGLYEKCISDCDVCKFKKYGTSCTAYKLANALYNAGYRLQSEVRAEIAKEFAEKIDNRKQWFLNGQTEYEHFDEQLKEIAESFGVEE